MSKYTRKYDAAHYKAWSASVKFELFDELEAAAKVEGSRPKLLEKMLDAYYKQKAVEEWRKSQ